MQLIDIGANLTHESFAHDLDEVLLRSHAHGVVRIMVTGASVAGSEAALALAEAYPGVLRATAGVHPHHAIDYDDAVDARLRTLLAHDQVRAVGETGLDYHRNYSPRAEQIVAFERQLQIAADCGKPLFLHQRDAHGDFLACLDAMHGHIGPVVVHCFTADRTELEHYLERNFHVGITGWICDERRGHHLRDIVGLIPADRLMLETDAPYLLPRDLPHKGSNRRNEPMYLAHICAAVAAARGEPVEATAAASTATARAFFGLPTDSL